MTSAYLTELQGRISVARDRLDEELGKVPVDYNKTAVVNGKLQTCLMR